MLVLREEYRVHASIVGSRDISLTIVLPSRSIPTCTPHNSLTGVPKIMKATRAPLWSTLSINN